MFLIDFKFSKAVNSFVLCQLRRYKWNFGNEVISTDKEPAITYGIHGVYHVTLTATDARDITNIAARDIIVNCIFTGADANSKHAQVI